MDQILKDELEDNIKTDDIDVFDTVFGQIPSLCKMTTAVLQGCKDTDPPFFQEDVGHLPISTHCCVN